MQKIAVSPERDLIYASPEIQKVINEVNLFAPTDERVLITGNHGTGKENIARLVHNGSTRKSGPFIAINCAAISPGLIESELFGHEKGSFTGADKQRIGAFETAKDGTIFLDEIGEMPPEMQAKLLRVLQDGEFYRVGNTKDKITARPRIIAATNKKLEEAIESGKFRADLYYRLGGGGAEIHLPDLKERPLDIDLLAQHFATKKAQQYDFPPPSFSADARKALREHQWPGNVRELENAVGAATVRAQVTGVITPELLFSRGIKKQPETAGHWQDSFGYKLSQHREQRGWSQTKLASEAGTRSGRSVSLADVQDWESNKAMPDADMLNALALTLIVQSRKSDDEKARDLEEFYKAAAATQVQPFMPGTFGNVIARLREQAGLTQQQLSNMASAFGNTLPLGQHDIYLLESNHPDRALCPGDVLSLVKALDRPEHPLSVEDKLELYEAAKKHGKAKPAAQAVQAQHHSKTPLERANDTPRSIRALLTQNGAIPLEKVAEQAGVSAKTLYSIIKDGREPGVEARLATYLEKRGEDPMELLHLLLQSGQATAAGSPGK